MLQLCSCSCSLCPASPYYPNYYYYYLWLCCLCIPMHSHSPPHIDCKYTHRRKSMCARAYEHFDSVFLHRFPMRMCLSLPVSHPIHNRKTCYAGHISAAPKFQYNKKLNLPFLSMSWFWLFVFGAIHIYTILTHRFMAARRSEPHLMHLTASIVNALYT